jgi:hypothetical protein
MKTTGSARLLGGAVIAEKPRAEIFRGGRILVDTFKLRRATELQGLAPSRGFLFDGKSPIS